MSLFDWIFPKRCVNCRAFGAYICPNCFSYISFLEHGFCVVCQRKAIGGVTYPICKSSYTIDGVFSSVAYINMVKKLIYYFKYKPYLSDSKSVLIDLFFAGLMQKEVFYSILTLETRLTPIPLHKTKLQERGYNQSYLLAAGLFKRFGLQVADCLERVRNTPTQVGLSQKNGKKI